VGRGVIKMKWQNDTHDGRAFSDQGYLLTWAYNSHGPWFNGWAPRTEGQRRGKHLAASYSRTDVERACDVHFSNKSRGTAPVQAEAHA
jgi:hypothetical protein